MPKNKAAAPALTHRNGPKNASIVHDRTFIVQEIEPFVHTLLLGCGAAGCGLTIGCALPALLGMAPWQPWPLLTGIALVLLGVREEKRQEGKEIQIHADDKL